MVKRYLIIFIISAIARFLIAQNYSFGPSIRINDDPPGVHLHSTEQRAIACRGDTVYLVWRDDRYENGLDPNSRIFFSKSNDDGNLWSPNLLIGHNLDTLWCSDPHIALDAFGNIYITYTTQNEINDNCDIYVVKSTNGGFSFSTPVMVNDSSLVIPQGPSVIAVDSSSQNVYVVWEDLRNLQYNRDIYFARSTNSGVSFLPSVRVNDDLTSEPQVFPVVTCDNLGQNVFIAWGDRRDSLHDWDVYFSRSTDYGQSFETNYPINDTTDTGNTVQWDPSISYKNGIIYTVWRDQRNGYCLYFAKSTNGGISFGLNVRVPDDPNAFGAYPSITVDDSAKVFIVWSDYRDYNNYGHDIYFAFSRDSGQTFSTNVRVNDHLGIVTAWDFGPSICVNDSGKVFVAWHGDRNDPSHSNFDIYFSTGLYHDIQEVANTKVSMFKIKPSIFIDHVTISFACPQKEISSKLLYIYDISGRLIKTIKTNDGQDILWDGRDQSGMTVPAGAYFVVAENAQDRKETIKVIKIK